MNDIRETLVKNPSIPTDADLSLLNYLYPNEGEKNIALQKLYNKSNLSEKLKIYSYIDESNPNYQIFQDDIIKTIGEKLKRPDIIVESGKKGDKSEYLEKLLQDKEVQEVISQEEKFHKNFHTENGNCLEN